MNEAEKIVQEKYIDWEYIRKGYPDFVFYKVIDDKIVNVRFVEVKSIDEKLKKEQLIFKRVSSFLNIPYYLEIISEKKLINRCKTSLYECRECKKITSTTNKKILNIVRLCPKCRINHFNEENK